MDELFNEIKLVYELLSEDSSSEVTKLGAFRGTLLEILAESYGYNTFEDWLKQLVHDLD